jgi:Ca2+/Na+ antiporter
MDPKIKNIAMFVLMGVGCFFFFLYFVNLDWYYALGVTLLYMYLLYRSYKRKEQILAEGESETK